MHLLLRGTPWAGVTWHCWRPLAATAMVALGAPITSVCIWNTWTSQRPAWEYAVPGPDWEFELPDQAPWPHAVAGTTTLPLSAVPPWPAGALGRRAASDASDSPIIIERGRGRFRRWGTGKPWHESWSGPGRTRTMCACSGLPARRSTGSARAFKSSYADPRPRRSRNGVSSANRSQREMVQPARASPQPTYSPSPDPGPGNGNWSPPQSACRR